MSQLVCDARQNLHQTFAVRSLKMLLGTKNLEGKDRQRQLLYYETLIRACNKVVYQLVYKGKKFVFLKEPLYLINQ